MGKRNTKRVQVDRAIGTFLLDIGSSGTIREDLFLSNKLQSTDPSQTEAGKQIVDEFMQKEKLVRIAYSIHKDNFPADIWYCCQRLCFVSLTSDPLQVQLLDELLQIHCYTEGCHKAAESLHCYVEERRKGVGTSTVAYATTSREERESLSLEEYGTPRMKQMQHFARFVAEVLPFLYGRINSPRGTTAPQRKLCTEAICCILGVSRNFLYYRKSIPSADDATEEELRSMVDIAELRLRQHRREGKRENYPPLQSLQTFDCGCDVPCFAESSPWILASEYQEFARLTRGLRPRHTENCYLLNRMFDPFFNVTTRACNRALSALYTVFESLIADVRLALNQICSAEHDDGRVLDRAILRDGSLRYNYHRGHPINRYGPNVRERVETTLDFVLRADPSGSGGREVQAVYRVYDPEINTQEKLREVLRKALDEDSDVEADPSSASLQRMVNDYLKQRNRSKISFQQPDHKTLKYAVLQYCNEVKILKRKLQEAEDFTKAPRPLTFSDHLLLPKRIDDLHGGVKTKQFQEENPEQDMRSHNERDGRIRRTVKELGDYFRKAENMLRHNGKIPKESHGWNSLPYHACITHQDDMTKVDLPHFVVNASSDITRWRFDVNAHVNSVTNDTVIFSYEKGTGAKNASMIFEEILSDHLVSCRGEDIKIVVSDNASVGKNWLTSIALPQYFVDQGLAKIVIIIFLENNHGKWLADMLFGQFQTRRRRSVLLGIDDLLHEFERVRRKSGKVQGFAVNPLSSVDFAEVLRSLGYQTSPPSTFGFVKRNIHFACACTAGAKKDPPQALNDIIGSALPDDVGMVRISTEPPMNRSRNENPHEYHYLDVPAVQLSSKKRVRHPVEDETSGVPLVVPLNQPYREKGNLVVSNRTAKNVDYNGLAFRKSKACPELGDTSKPLARRAWPGFGEWSDERGSVQESMRCAPENWAVRGPVSFFCDSDADWKARYSPPPPQDLAERKVLSRSSGDGYLDTNSDVCRATVSLAVRNLHQARHGKTRGSSYGSEGVIACLATAPSCVRGHG